MKIRRVVFSDRFAPVFLLIVALLGFGILLPWLGFYWDDWAKILVARVWGLPAYFSYYAEDRPLSAWTHIVFTPLLGYRPLPWHLFTLLLRWLSAWAAWLGLNQMWPQARRQNLVATLIFLVHPVFVSQPAAVTFHQQWLQWVLVLLSFWLMLRAAAEHWSAGKAGSKFWALAAGALLAMLAQLTVTEYFAPVELLRPLLLWFLAGRADLQMGGAAGAAGRWKRTLAAWAPYLLVTGGYVAWRLFFQRLPGADPYRAETLYAFLEAPLATLQQVSWTALVDELHILVNSWAALLDIQLNGLTRFELLTYGVGAGAAALSAVYLANLRRDGAVEEPAGDGGRWIREALVLGIAAALLGPVPAWITGRQVVFDFHSDRYAMPAMLGAGLVAAGVIEWLAQRRVQRAVLAGVLVGLAVALHLRVANDYRWIWTAEQRAFWELAWRAPGLKTPTAVFFESEPFPNQGLFSTSAALNLMYPQPAGAQNLGYWIYTLRPRYRSAPDPLEIGFNTTFRTLHFEGQTPASLLVYNNRTFANCLWVLSERDARHPYLPQLVKDFLPVSNLERIEPVGTPGYPPADTIGAEPPRTSWCYYFEKADLARQQGDWTAAAELYDQAAAQGYVPARSESNSPYEWLPFIEGLARNGRWDDAADLTGQAFARDDHYRGMLCELWDELGQQNGGVETAARVSEALSCAR